MSYLTITTMYQPRGTTSPRFLTLGDTLILQGKELKLSFSEWSTPISVPLPPDHVCDEFKAYLTARIAKILDEANIIAYTKKVSVFVKIDICDLIRNDDGTMTARSPCAPHVIAKTGIVLDDACIAFVRRKKKSRRPTQHGFGLVPNKFLDGWIVTFSPYPISPPYRTIKRLGTSAVSQAAIAS